MRVTNWQKWNNAKRRIGLSMVSLGIFLSFGIESSLWWGVIAVLVGYSGCMTLYSIQPYERWASSQGLNNDRHNN